MYCEGVGQTIPEGYTFSITIHGDEVSAAAGNANAKEISEALVQLQLEQIRMMENADGSDTIQ